MSHMNPKEVCHNTAYSVHLPYIAGHSLWTKYPMLQKLQLIQTPNDWMNKCMKTESIQSNPYIVLVQ